MDLIVEILVKLSSRNKINLHLDVAIF